METTEVASESDQTRSGSPNKTSENELTRSGTPKASENEQNRSGTPNKTTESELTRSGTPYKASESELTRSGTPYKASESRSSLTRSGTPYRTSESELSRSSLSRSGTPYRVGSFSSLTRSGTPYRVGSVGSISGITNISGLEDSDVEVMERSEVEVLERVASAGSVDSFGSVDSGTYVSPRASARESFIPDTTQMREYLVSSIREATLQQQRLALLNEDLQRKLIGYFKNQKDDEHIERIVEQEKYFRCLDELEALREQLRNMSAYYDTTIQDMKARYAEKEAKATEIKESFLQFKREIAKDAEHSKSGKLFSLKKLSTYEEEEQQRDQMLEKVRLKHINLRKRYGNLEKVLRQREELKNGLHLIDFEQLKIENQTFTEKIEERNLELQKLRKKITSTVHMVSHVKEKLQFVQAQNAELKKKLEVVEQEVVAKRDQVGGMKQERDALRAENVEQKQKSGLIGSDDLLRDFEKRRDELNEARNKLAELQATHKELVDRMSLYRTASA